jgi:hypothetical protein
MHSSIQDELAILMERLERVVQKIHHSSRPSVFGAALQYFTGSKAHNVRLRRGGARRLPLRSDHAALRRSGPRTR